MSGWRYRMKRGIRRLGPSFSTLKYEAKVERYKYHHPWDRGGPLQICVTEAFKPLLENSFWAKHDMPFSKRRSGRARRAARLFRAHEKMSFFNEESFQ